MPDRRAAAAVQSALLVTGCAGIPHGGEVNVGRELPAAGGLGDVDVRVLPPAPVPGMTPSGIVRGFLRAMVNPDGGYEIARGYLTGRAASSWNPGAGVTTYDDNGVQILPRHATDGLSEVELVAPRLGFLDQRGSFTPRQGAVRTTFSLARAGGEWRIDRLPSGVLLSTLDVQRSYRLADVFYLNRAGTTLVPEQILLRPQPRITTALVRALLNGPGDWIGPAVRTAFPAHTDLLGNVPVDAAGVAEVNLTSSVRQASPAQLKALSAQLLWTLRQVPDVTAVEILADGAAVAVPGWGVRQPRSAWASYDPAAPPAVTTGFYRHGARWRSTGSPLPVIARLGAVDALAVSSDGSTVAGVRGGELYVERAGAAPVRRLHADSLTPPTFDESGNVWTVVTRGADRWVAQVPPSGAAHRIAADRRLVSGPVQSMRLSRDGSRVAAVVGPTGRGRLLVGLVTQARGQLRLDRFRAVLGDAVDVRGLAWQNASELVVTVGDATGSRRLVAVDVDGYNPRTVAVSGLGAGPVDVAAAPERPLLLVAAGEVWREDARQGWRRVAAGASPVYAD